jgi:hypothetical protein
MSKKNKIELKYEFDSPQIRASWLQIMRENADGMAVGLRKILEDVGVASDPKIYLKEDKNLIVVKTINTDKGFVLVYDKKQENLITKPYKLVADNEVYLAFFGKDLLAFFRRVGGVDHNTGKGFESVEYAVKGLKQIDDPIVVEERIRQRDIEDGIIDEDGNPLPQKNDAVIDAVIDAVPPVK